MMILRERSLIDPNMITAYSWACGLFKSDLPPSLNDLTKRTKLIDEINSLLFTANDPGSAKKLLADLDHDERTKRLNTIRERSKSYMTEDLDDNIRKNILLRLWAGCMDAAKNIALQTINGPNSADDRKEGFFFIDLLSKPDPIYRAGTESAPSFKKLHRQHYSFAGVPSGSAVTKYPNEYLLQDDTCMCI
jgi:hypothetical protein